MLRVDAGLLSISASLSLLTSLVLLVALGGDGFIGNLLILVLVVPPYLLSHLLYISSLLTPLRSDRKIYSSNLMLGGFINLLFWSIHLTIPGGSMVKEDVLARLGLSWTTLELAFATLGLAYLVMGIYNLLKG